MESKTLMAGDTREPGEWLRREFDGLAMIQAADKTVKRENGKSIRSKGQYRYCDFLFIETTDLNLRSVLNQHISELAKPSPFKIGRWVSILTIAITLLDKLHSVQFENFGFVWATIFLTGGVRFVLDSLDAWNEMKNSKLQREAWVSKKDSIDRIVDTLTLSNRDWTNDQSSAR